ncbi:MAG: hypothetical protein EOO51_01800 [Flavobacterium sp.]|nr:MAG: hypothetical protein EOO51_01800 [Flavobacterium sp.]
MKKLMYLCLIALAISACKSKSATETGLNLKQQKMMNGSWTLTAVTTPANNYIKVNTFEIADSKCFEGSKWKLVSNNNKGEMSLSNGAADCPAFSSPITWFRNKNNQFVLKILNAGEKARKVRDGYVLDVANQTENSFELIDMVDVAGKKANVVYHFEKN